MDRLDHNQQLWSIYSLPVCLGSLPVIGGCGNGNCWVGIWYDWRIFSAWGYQKLLSSPSGKDALVVHAHCQHGRQLHFGSHGFYCCEHTNPAIQLGAVGPPGTYWRDAYWQDKSQVQTPVWDEVDNNQLTRDL